MSLPYGTDPKDSNIYRELSSIQLKDLTQSEFETQIKGIFVDAPQEDDLRRVILVGHSTGQLGGSGICSNSQVVEAYKLDTSGEETLLEPLPGERFGLQVFSVEDLGGSSQVTFSIKKSGTAISCPLFDIFNTGGPGAIPYTGKGIVLTYPNVLTAKRIGTITTSATGHIVYSAVR